MCRHIFSLCFHVFFYTWTFIYFLFFRLCLFFKDRAFVYRLYHLWGKVVFWGLKRIVGLDYRIEGSENLLQLKGACIIACQHQSAFETIVFGQLVDDVSIVLKKELLSVPLFGAYLKKMGSIRLDRENGPQSLKYLLRQGRQVKAENRPILIFPEGTRIRPGEKGVYHPGVGALYRYLELPVFPVALDSGVFWGRHSWLKKSGTITLRFCPPIFPGLNQKEFMETLKLRLSQEI